MIIRPRSTLRQPPALVALLISLALAASSAALAKPAATFRAATAAGAELKYVDGVPVAIFSGTPEEMGRQYAALLTEPMQRAVEYPKHFAAAWGMEALYPLAEIAGRALLVNAPQRHRDELAALQSHSHVGDGELAVANTMLELRRIGCSALIVEPQHSATGGPLFGRNLDFETLGELDKYSLVAIHRPQGRHAFASIGFVGLIGVISGMNDAGLAVATLDVEQSADGSLKFDPTGTPLCFVFRRILEECTTIDEAERLLREAKATTWMNLAVCDRDNGAVFEITPKTIGRRNDEAGFVRCTNHFRTAGLSTDEQCWRYDELPKSEDPSAPVDVAVVQRALHSVTQGDMTLQTMIFEPRRLMLHLALGKPDVSDDPLVTLDLRPLLAPSAPSGEAASAAGSPGAAAGR